MKQIINIAGIIEWWRTYYMQNAHL